ncbi:MAG: DNA polymerase III subunit delta' [Spirulinaceae cyanobacterium SM2_1_0]|nr:DNA polymerase III subunit delta' [Spirulinaceae cyanobacterium SM2_1_0]
MADPFAGLVGQESAIALLRAAIAQDRLAPAYLFVGAAGIGRERAALGFCELILRQGGALERLARLGAQVRDRNHPDLLWVEPTYQHKGQLLSASEAVASGVQRRSLPKIRIEQVRAIAQFVARPPLAAARSVVVVTGAELMAESPANALLKTLEEPGRAILILIAPSADVLLPTLVSRCQRVPFHSLGREDLARVLQQVGRAELLEQPTVLALAQGSPGAALAAAAQLEVIDAEVLAQLRSPPSVPLAALHLAKQVAQALDVAAQVWLLDYLQHQYWQDFLQAGWVRSPLPLLDRARDQLLHYVQPRLVWECLLLALRDCRAGSVAQ